jgi:ABC-type Mn2+/Zn2+ transport system ATPase subunit
VTELARVTANSLRRPASAPFLARPGTGRRPSLLDEPQNNLDAAGAQCRLAIRAATAAGKTAVIATHDIEDASTCDYALLLAQRVVAFGPGCSVLTPQALLETLGVAIRLGNEDVIVAERSHRHECGEDGG